MWILETILDKGWNCHPVTSGNRALLSSVQIEDFEDMKKLYRRHSSLCSLKQGILLPFTCLEHQTANSSSVNNEKMSVISNSVVSCLKGIHFSRQVRWSTEELAKCTYMAESRGNACLNIVLISPNPFPLPTPTHYLLCEQLTCIALVPLDIWGTSKGHKGLLIVGYYIVDLLPQLS